MGCFVVAKFLLTSASRGRSATAELIVSYMVSFTFRAFILYHCHNVSYLSSEPRQKQEALRSLCNSRGTREALVSRNPGTTKHLT